MLTQWLEAETKLQQISQIFMFAKEAYLYTEYFHKPDTPEELEVSTNSPHAGHLMFIRHIMYRTLVIELAKLFSKSRNDHYRIHAYIQSFRPGGLNVQFQIPESIITNWENLLSQKTETINDVLALRDKIYAHTDKDKDEFLNIDLSFTKIQTLLMVAEQIITDIYRIAFSTTLITEPPSFERERFGILKLLAKAENQRKEEIFRRHRLAIQGGSTQ